MPHDGAFEVPAVCDDCGRAFPSGIAGSDAIGIVLSGTRSGPCPFCGATGTVPDGVYDIGRDGWELVSWLSTSREDLLKAAGILQDELATGAPDLARIERRLEDEAPGAMSLMGLLRDPATQTVVGLVAVVLMVIIAVLD